MPPTFSTFVDLIETAYQSEGVIRILSTIISISMGVMRAPTIITISQTTVLSLAIDLNNEDTRLR